MPEIKVSSEWRAKEREFKEIRKDIYTARNVIADGLARYKKKMLKARSKKQAEDLSVFAVLDGFSSKLDIQNAYGYADITEDEMRRLYELWDLREEKITADGRFEDRVTQMLKRAMENIGEEFLDMLSDFDDMARQDKEARLRIETENAINNNIRYQAGL